jgi:hypothetical protein
MPKICVSLVRIKLKETGKCENGKSKHQAGFESATLSTNGKKWEQTQVNERTSVLFVPAEYCCFSDLLPPPSHSSPAVRRPKLRVLTAPSKNCADFMEHLQKQVKCVVTLSVNGSVFLLQLTVFRLGRRKQVTYAVICT